MGLPSEYESDPETLERFAADLLHGHIRSRRASGAWGQLDLVLVFEHGELTKIRTIDEAEVRVDLLKRSRTSRQAATRQSE